LFVLIFIPFFDLQFPSDTSIWLSLLLSGLFLGLSDYLLVYGSINASAADSSILVPLSNLYIVIVGGIFLQEEMNILKIVSVVLIILGSILTLWKGKKLAFNKGILAIILFGFAITANYSIDKGISDNFNPTIYVFLTYFISATFLCLLSVKRIFSKIRNEFFLNKKAIISVGIIWGIFTLTLVLAYRVGEASKIIPFMRLFIVMITFYSIFVMKEKERMWQKIVGSVLVTCGAILIAYN
jgi:drug/metabolite transporter (DMT)-like permease